ncbi:ATP-dependent protease La Type I, partial [hydrothermal vent metagenome]
ATVDDVLAHALTRKLTPIEWTEPVTPPAEESDSQGRIVTH